MLVAQPYAHKKPITQRVQSQERVTSNPMPLKQNHPIMPMKNPSINIQTPQKTQNVGQNNMQQTHQRPSLTARSTSVENLLKSIHQPQIAKNIIHLQHQQQQNYQKVFNQHQIQQQAHAHTNLHSLNHIHQQQNQFTRFIQDNKPVLPPQNPKNAKKYTLVLDLDETLVHTFKVTGTTVDFYTRPYYKEFLQSLQNDFELVVFTAALREYADVVLDNLDPEKILTHRLYRQHMKMYKGQRVKDLSVLGRDLSKTIIVDNLEDNFDAQPENGYLIKDFVDDPKDQELKDLQILLKTIVFLNIDDVRQVLKKKKEILQDYKQNPLIFRLAQYPQSRQQISTPNKQVSEYSTPLKPSKQKYTPHSVQNMDQDEENNRNRVFTQTDEKAGKIGIGLCKNSQLIDDPFDNILNNQNSKKESDKRLFKPNGNEFQIKFFTPSKKIEGKIDGSNSEKKSQSFQEQIVSSNGLITNVQQQKKF